VKATSGSSYLYPSPPAHGCVTVEVITFVTGAPGRVIVVGLPVMVTVFPRPTTVEILVEVITLVTVPPPRTTVETLVAVLPRPVTETVLGRPVTVTVLSLPVTVAVVARHGTVDTLVEVITFVMGLPSLVTVDARVTVVPRPVMVTVLPGLDTVDTRVDVTVLVC